MDPPQPSPVLPHVGFVVASAGRALSRPHAPSTVGVPVGAPTPSIPGKKRKRLGLLRHPPAAAAASHPRPCTATGGAATVAREGEDVRHWADTTEEIKGQGSSCPRPLPRGSVAGTSNPDPYVTPNVFEETPRGENFISFSPCIELSRGPKAKQFAWLIM